MKANDEALLTRYLLREGLPPEDPLARELFRTSSGFAAFRFSEACRALGLAMAEASRDLIQRFTRHRA